MDMLHVILFCGLMNASGEIQHRLGQCLSEIALRYFTPERTVVVSYRSITSNQEEPGSTVHKHVLDVSTQLLEEVHEAYNWPLLVSSRRNRALAESRNKHGSYVMFAETGNVVQDVRNQLIDLKTHFGWNSRAKFVVAIVGPLNRLLEGSLVEDVLNELWTEKTANTIVIFYYEELTTLHIYTHFPYYPPSRCGHNPTAVFIDQWVVNKEGEGNFLLGAPLFPDKIPLNFHGCPFKISTFEFEPLVTKPTLINNKRMYSEGLEIRVLELVMNAMNLSPIYRSPPENGKWGIRLENGSWNGIYGEVIDHLSDVAVCGMVLDNIRSRSADFTVPHEGLEISWHVPCAKPFPRWASLTRVFTPSLWLGFFLIYVIVSVVMWMVLHIRKTAKREYYMNLETCFLNLWAVILSVSASGSASNRTVLRFIFLLWVWYSLVVNTVYQTFLTSFLVDPGVQDQLNTEEELVNSDLKLGFNSYMALHSDEVFTDRYKRRVICEDIDQCVERLAVQGDLAFLISKFVGRYKASFKFLRAGGKPGFCCIKDDFSHVWMVMYLQKGSLYLDRFNSILLRMWEAGMVDHWREEIIYTAMLAGSRESAMESDPNFYISLSLVHLQSAFYCLVLGYMLSLATVISESVYVRGRYFCKGHL